MNKATLEVKKQEMQKELAKGGQLLAQTQKKIEHIKGAIAILDELIAEASETEETDKESES